MAWWQSGLPMQGWRKNVRPSAALATLATTQCEDRRWRTAGTLVLTGPHMHELPPVDGGGALTFFADFVVFFERSLVNCLMNLAMMATQRNTTTR